MAANGASTDDPFALPYAPYHVVSWPCPYVAVGDALGAAVGTVRSTSRLVCVCH